jgi:acyl-coenzyme A synthetase/AMP-(fatty) acid ligase
LRGHIGADRSAGPISGGPDARPRLPGITTLKPGSATFPFPGIKADVVDEAGNSVPLGGGG